ncbi:VPEID-CTERM sorting domain-containing protein [Pseudodonghicola flavimaris]|uniref:VPEID-CTERM sorting domain-containing protein n=1 Tax=Pseudodonghicola flavimaris TaxID=3050036 RepID=A0ABT7F7D7_9RHOB|nr:VPEID-CTERM sorting domain-containing protein [Pseudodonghicola flavimaris]MDK3020518.1 VPEID-CTERM sorting domain-containing protein [Pseudodonghicola flavimaris]
MRKLIIATASVPALFASTLSASAQTSAGTFGSFWDWCWGDSGSGSSSQVPEIDASTSLLAVAAIGAALILSWELKRRRA